MDIKCFEHLNIFRTLAPPLPPPSFLLPALLTYRRYLRTSFLNQSRAAEVMLEVLSGVWRGNSCEYVLGTRPCARPAARVNSCSKPRPSHLAHAEAALHPPTLPPPLPILLLRPPCLPPCSDASHLSSTNRRTTSSPSSCCTRVFWQPSTGSGKRGRPSL